MSDRSDNRQARAYGPGMALFLLMGLGLALSLAACGKKPGHVDPPLGVDDDQFPKIYPDPATDPKPEPPPK